MPILALLPISFNYEKTRLTLGKTETGTLRAELLEILL